MRRSFLLITTRDLREAYFLVRYLESRDQRIAVLNHVGRPLAAKIRVLARLGRNRGLPYLADLLLGRALRTRERHLGADPFPEIDPPLVEELKQRHPRMDCRDLHAADALRFVKVFAPDYILLGGAPIIKPALYGLARFAALNRHLGLLPDYRGSDCAMWALAMNRPESVGFSIHVVAEKADAGDVIVRQPVATLPGATFAEYLACLQRTASEAFVGVLERLLRGDALERWPQPYEGAYYPPAGHVTIRRAAQTYARLASGATVARVEPVAATAGGRGAGVPRRGADGG
jgi:folate-dependent phosphoribosylglycinamide formyltransferase PurN